jgi:putative hydrolase of the HAD superfamily
MVKAVLFDVDGVVFKPRDKYFSERLREKGKDVPESKVLPFFKNEYKKIVVGKAKLKEGVKKYLSDWNWEGTAEELLNYWFTYEDKIDQDVIGLARELRDEGVKCYLASDHSRYRTDDFMNRVGLTRYFDGVFSSGYLGYTKEDVEFFETVLKKLGLSNDQVVFVDDDPENIKVAEKVGINSKLFENKDDSVEELREWITQRMD